MGSKPGREKKMKARAWSKFE